jgi:hypothetical protein
MPQNQINSQKLSLSAKGDLRAVELDLCAENSRLSRGLRGHQEYCKVHPETVFIKRGVGKS